MQRDVKIYRPNLLLRKACISVASGFTVFALTGELIPAFLVFLKGYGLKKMMTGKRGFL